MTTALTQEQLTKSLQSFKTELHNELATKTDILDMEGRILEMEGRMATKGDMTDLKSSFSDLQTSVDRYLKFTEAWHQELTILKSRQDRLAQVLIDKGIVSEKEIALLG